MDENLITKNMQDVNADVDVSRVKLIILGIFSLLSAGALGFALKSVVANGSLDLSNILNVVLADLFFLTVFLFQVLLVKSQKIHGGLLLADSVALFVPFFPNLSWLLLAGFLLLVLGLWNANRKGLVELDSGLKIQFFRVARRTLPAAITALSLFVSIAYVDVNGVGTAFLSREAFRAILKPAEPLVRGLVASNFSMDMTVYKFAEGLAEQQLGSDFTALPASSKIQTVEGMLNSLRGQAASYGIIFKSSDTITDVFYKYFDKQYKSIPQNYLSLVPYAIFLITFLTVRSLGGLLNGISSVFAYIIFQILLASGFARIGLESRSREMIIVG